MKRQKGEAEADHHKIWGEGWETGGSELLAPPLSGEVDWKPGPPSYTTEKLKVAVLKMPKGEGVVANVDVSPDGERIKLHIGDWVIEVTAREAQAEEA